MKPCQSMPNKPSQDTLSYRTLKPRAIRLTEENQTTKNTDNQTQLFARPRVREYLPQRAWLERRLCWSCETYITLGQ